jgi:hypothetical protein
VPRSKVVVLLLVWFLWAAGKDLDALVRYSVTSDFYILASAGAGWLFFAMGIVVLCSTPCPCTTSGGRNLARPGFCSKRSPRV